MVGHGKAEMLILSAESHDTLKEIYSAFDKALGVINESETGADVDNERMTGAVSEVRYSAMYLNKAKNFGAFYDFVHDNKNNPAELNKSFYTVDLSDGSALDIFFDNILHGYNNHKLSKGEYADIFNGLGRGAVEATVKETGRGSVNAVSTKAIIETPRGFAGVMVEYQPNGRIILRTAFYDAHNALKSWIRKDDFKALSPNGLGSSQLLDNRLSISSILDAMQNSQAQTDASVKGSP